MATGENTIERFGGEGMQPFPAGFCAEAIPTDRSSTVGLSGILVPRPGRGTAGCRAGENVPRSLMERVFGRPAAFREAANEHSARLYALPGAMRAGFAQFAAFDQDAIDNQLFLAAGKLTMPIFAIGGEKSFAGTMAVVMRTAATDVQELVVANSGHWLMEEQPAAVAAICTFLD